LGGGKFLGLQRTNKNGHKIPTQEEHPIHHQSVTSFSINCNKTDKSRLEYEIT